MSEEQITYKTLYELMGAMEIRLTNKIESVHHAFLVLEEGKVSRLDKEVAELKLKIEQLEKEKREKSQSMHWGIGIWITLGIAISTLLSGILLHFWK